MKRTVVITENISEPIDEGVKKFSYYLAKYISGLNSENRIFSVFGNSDIPDIRQLPKNKLFFSLVFFRFLYSYKPQLLVYIPSSSSTLMSFIRLVIVSVFSGNSEVIMISLQERKHNNFSKLIIRFLKPDKIIVLSNKESNYYKKLGINCIISPIGVETGKYLEISAIEKKRLRQKLALPADGKIILHVGHIKKGRNLEILKGLTAEGFYIVIVASTRFEPDIRLKGELQEAGFLFITNYVQNIEEYYQASDIYVFPVESATNAMEFPMSVLEAMSCNLPVLTTRFGGIESFLPESDWIKYFSNEDELKKKIMTIPENKECNNRKIVLSHFAWNNVFNNLFMSNNLQ